MERLVKRTHIDFKVALLFVAIVIGHLAFNSKLQIHFDEAYYWVWSKNLQLSYFDHPPMIAYLIRLTTLFSDSIFCIRLVSVICGSITAIFIYKSAKYTFGQKAGNIAMILALAWPILEGTFFVTTIDSPFLMFWSITVYCLIRGLVFDEKKFVYIGGIVLGLTLLSKYIGILILPGVLIYLALSAKHRIKLVQKDIYLSLLLVIVIFSPVIIWNAEHGWASFVFQFNHGTAESKQFNLQSFGDYIAGFLGAANPFISIPIFVFAYKKRKQIIKDDRYLFLLSNFLFIGLFFGYNALFKKQEANWVAPAYIAGIIFLAGCLAQTNIKWIHRVAISLILILFPLIKMPEIFVPVRYQNKIPQIDVFTGQKQLYGAAKKDYWHNDEIVMSCNYKIASRAWYYMNVGRVYVLPEFNGSNTYKFWNSSLHSPMTNTLYVCDSDNTSNGILQKYFKNIEPLGIEEYHDNFVNNKLYVFRLSN
jgi:4-amino-4-deoxy-L-arabinose transferase-like glycosyltransferase